MIASNKYDVGVKALRHKPQLEASLKIVYQLEAGLKIVYLSSTIERDINR